MDLILALGPQTDFWKAKPTTSEANACKPREYQLEADITEPVLRKLVYFDYHSTCNFTQTNSFDLASVGVKYGINTLVNFCLDDLVQNFSMANVLKAYEWNCKEQFDNKKAQLFFQKYIEDNFEKVSH